MDLEAINRSDRLALGGLDDSKVMDAERREALYPVIMRTATRVAVTARCAPGIDRRGLHVTNLEALRDTLRRVAVAGSLCLVDGFALPDLGLPHRAVKGGDRTSAAIAAASVIAKVSRDRYMHRAATRFPHWGFDEHVGYSTPTHRAAIAERGVTALHRRSFASVAYHQLELAG